MKFARGVLNLDAADQLINHRLHGTLIHSMNGEAAGQKKLVEDADLEIEGVFDLKRFGFNAEYLTTSLQFSINDIDVEEMCQMAYGEGRLVVKSVSEIPAEVKDTKPARSAAVKADGPWRKVPLSDLFHGAVLKALNDADIETVGALADWRSGGKEYTAIKGIGPEKATQIENGLESFWDANRDALED